MTRHITNSWKEVLSEEFKKGYFKDLIQFVNSAYTTAQCYPEFDNIFAAFNYSDLKTTKVVILGQDPYHGKGQANGLSFSVNDGVKHPPSLVNILKELSDNYDTLYPATGNLEAWAKQGVLLLNATLTVQESNAGSHQKKGWEQFTDAVIQHISEKKEDVVFLLWGGFAKKKARLIDASKHHILTSGHPSPLSANRGLWFGNNHFIKTNNFLKSKGITEIDWRL